MLTSSDFPTTNMNTTFDGLDVLNKIKACLNDMNCGISGQQQQNSLETLQNSVSGLVNHSDQRSLSDMPFPVDWDSIYVGVICFAYAVIIVVSILGNFLVCHVIISMRRNHTVTNLFILNLAISDFLITCLNIPFSLVRLFVDDWPLGSILCQLLPFVQVTAVYVSSWTMVGIAYDRLRVIVFPLRPRLTFRAGIIMVAIMWLLSMAVSSPYAVIHQVTQFQFAKPTKLCAALYPSGYDFRQYLSLGTFVLQFFVPLNITGFCYGIIGLNLWSTKTILKSSSLSRQNNHMSSILRNRQKTIKMLVAVVMVFAGCWLPISLYHLTRDFNPQNDSSNHNVFVFVVLHWLAMSSVAYNPGIYCCWNQCYRVQARRLYGRLFRCCGSTDDDKHPPQVQIEGLIVRFSRKADYQPNGSVQFSQRSFNWDSQSINGMHGIKEILHLQEGKRTFQPAPPVAL